MLDAFAASAAMQGARTPGGAPAEPVQLVHNPSTCYHCYAARRGTTIAGDLAITAIAKCHRYEAANHADFGRLLEFSLREVIFLNSPDYVRACRERRAAQEVATLLVTWLPMGLARGELDFRRFRDFAGGADLWPYAHCAPMPDQALVGACDFGLAGDYDHGRADLRPHPCQVGGRLRRTPGILRQFSPGLLSFPDSEKAAIGLVIMAAAEIWRRHLLELQIRGIALRTTLLGVLVLSALLYGYEQSRAFI